jgi:hypothetical protein
MNALVDAAKRYGRGEPVDLQALDRHAQIFVAWLEGMGYGSAARDLRKERLTLFPASREPSPR